MPDFRCRVGTPEGAIAERFLSAPTPAAAREQLAADGFEVFDVAQRSQGTLFPSLQKLASIQIGGSSSGEETASGLFRRRAKMAPADLLLINQELASLIHAGLPLLRCIDILRTRRAGSLTGAVLDRARRRIAAGASLSVALQPEIEKAGLPELYVTSIEVGEASGDLVTALRRYTSHLEKSIALGQRVKTAMTYPIVLAAVATIVVTILLIVVIPQFASFYEASGAELPLTTRMLVGFAGLVSSYGLLAVLAIVLGVAFYRRWAATDAGRNAIDAAKLRTPLLGALRRRYFGLETARTLATLLRGGAPLVNALRVTATGTNNRAFRRRLLETAEQVSHGSDLHSALEEHGLLDPLGLEMVQVGESTGSLEEMLEHVADAYDEVLDRQVTNAVNMVQPAMLVVMGILVAGVLLSLYLPLFQTVQAVG
jgi:type IV pilus assembly protein PilC